MQASQGNPRNAIRPLDAEFAEYLRDESRVSGQAESISFPHTEEEIRAIVRELAATGTRLTVQGGRTGLASGAVPQGGHILNLGRMTKLSGLRQGQDGHFYLRVEPGLVLLNLRKMLESRKLDTSLFNADSLAAYRAFQEAPEQFFATDPTETSATLGGIAACNASGARSFLYGPVRPYIQALRVVLADGQTLALQRGQTRAQGRKLLLTTEQGQTFPIELPQYQMPATKNASGYYIEDNLDAVDLFIGSDGTLGIITELELKLLPLPAVIWGVSCFTADEAQASALVQAVRRELTQVASMEYFDAGSLQILRAQKAGSSAFSQLPEVPPHYRACIYFELHCAKEEAALERLFRIGELMVEAGADAADTWVARTAVDRDRLLFFRHAVPESVNMLIDARKKEDATITKLGTDMSVPDVRLDAVLRMYRQMLDERGLESATWGHIGDNHLHVNILPRDAADYASGKELYRLWAQAVSAQGGAVSAEHGVGKLKAEFLTIMYGEQAVRQMAATKAALDPACLLGAGNLFPPEWVAAAAKGGQTA